MLKHPAGLYNVVCVYVYCTYRDQIVEVQRAVHLEVGHGHDDGVDQIGTVRQTAEGLEEAARQSRVDTSSMTGTAGDHDPGEGGAPG